MCHTLGLNMFSLFMIELHLKMHRCKTVTIKVIAKHISKLSNHIEIFESFRVKIIALVTLNSRLRSNKLL